MTPETEFEVVDITKVTLENLNDLLITAVEGGTNYWAEVRNYDHKSDIVTVEFREDDQQSAEKPGWHAVSAMDMLRILPEIRKHSGQAKDWNITEIIENCDGEIADIAVQLAIFGEVVYG
jgi:hypothetical protein